MFSEELSDIQEILQQRMSGSKDDDDDASGESCDAILQINADDDDDASGESCDAILQINARYKQEGFS